MNEDAIIIKTTEDGSSTLFNTEIGECYHSIHGARAESMHIFINAALNTINKHCLKVFEMGFGTGLNAMLTAIEAISTHKSISYTSIELFPIKNSIYKELNYPQNTYEQEIFYKIHESEWGKKCMISDNFELTKIHGSILETDIGNGYDVVYYDAFSPEKQPDLWTQDIFNKIYNSMNNGGVITTYCAKGDVRRAMIGAGLSVEKLAGPPGKRHILRGIKII